METDRVWRIEADYDAVTEVAVAVRHHCEGLMQPQDAGDVELVLVEVLNNLIRHGYSAGPGAIEVSAHFHPGGCRIRVVDWGQPIPAKVLDAARQGAGELDFDPFDLDNLPVGGMGLPLLFAVMDDVTYTSVNGRNELSLVRHRR